MLALHNTTDAIMAAMPCQTKVVRDHKGESEEDRDIGRVSAADCTFPCTILQGRRANSEVGRPIMGRKHAMEWNANLG